MRDRHRAYVLAALILRLNAGVLDWGATNEGDLQEILDEEDNVKTRIIFAREELKVLNLEERMHSVQSPMTQSARL